MWACVNTAYVIFVTLAFYFTSLLMHCCNVSPLWIIQHLNTQIDIWDVLLRMFIACMKWWIKDVEFMAWNVLSVLPVVVTVALALDLYATGFFQHALGSVSGISHVFPHWWGNAVNVSGSASSRESCRGSPRCTSVHNGSPIPLDSMRGKIELSLPYMGLPVHAYTRRQGLFKVGRSHAFHPADNVHHAAFYSWI